MSETTPPIPAKPLNAQADKGAALGPWRRIDAALARIEVALRNGSKVPASARDGESAAALALLRQRHGALRIATAGALDQIDALINACDARPDAGPTSTGPDNQP